MYVSGILATYRFCVVLSVINFVFHEKTDTEASEDPTP